MPPLEPLELGIVFVLGAAAHIKGNTQRFCRLVRGSNGLMRSCILLQVRHLCLLLSVSPALF